MVNSSLLDNTIHHIRCNPELHNQMFFYEVSDFGMTACFAGRALLLAGYKPVMTHYPRGCKAEDPHTGAFVKVCETARDVLGLDDQWAVNLFRPDNTREMLELKVKDLLNGSPLDRYHELLRNKPE